VPPKPNGKNDRNDRIAFTRGSAERIAKVVRQVESGNRDEAALSFGSRVPVSGPAIRMATFTGFWSKDTSRIVTIRNSTATLSAFNVFGVAGSTSSGTWDCCVIRDGTAWFCIQGECVT
jgi:hypothetical protein